MKAAATAAAGAEQVPTEPEIVLAGHRGALGVLVFTEHLNATCVISFERPLRLLHAQGRVNFAVASQRRVKAAGAGCWRRWIARMRPAVVVLSRYALPDGPSIAADARRMGAAVIYHIDDDLLELPASLSAGVVRTHGAADVVQARATLLREADLVYASTPFLASVLAGRLPGQKVIHGEIYCSYEPLRPAPEADGPVIGYMGSRGHQQDLMLAVPALDRLLEERTALRFEVFGSIPMPEQLQRFGERVRAHAVQQSYGEFLQTLSGLGWSIGLAPLADEPFNRCKAPTKYIEYSGAGIACIASREPVYGAVVQVGAGELVDCDWYGALIAWLDQPEARRRALEQARRNCERTFSLDRLAEQVLGILQDAARDVPAWRTAAGRLWMLASRAGAIGR